MKSNLLGPDPDTPEGQAYYHGGGIIAAQQASYPALYKKVTGQDLPGSSKTVAQLFQPTTGLTQSNLPMYPTGYKFPFYASTGQELDSHGIPYVWKSDAGTSGAYVPDTGSGEYRNLPAGGGSPLEATLSKDTPSQSSTPSAPKNQPAAAPLDWSAFEAELQQDLQDLGILARTLVHLANSLEKVASLLKNRAFL